MEIDETNTEKTRKRPKIDIDALSESSDIESSAESDLSTYMLRSGEKVCRKKYKVEKVSSKKESFKDESPKDESSKQISTAELYPQKSLESTVKTDVGNPKVSVSQNVPITPKLALANNVPAVAANPGFVLSPYLFNPLMNCPIFLNNLPMQNVAGIANSLPIQNIAGLGNNIAIVGGNLIKSSLPPIAGSTNTDSSTQNLTTTITSSLPTQNLGTFGNNIAIVGSSALVASDSTSPVVPGKGRAPLKKASVDNKRFVQYSPGLNFVSGLRLPGCKTSVNAAVVQNMVPTGARVGTVVSSVPQILQPNLKNSEDPKNCNDGSAEKIVEDQKMIPETSGKVVKRNYTDLSEIAKGDNDLVAEIANRPVKRGRKKKVFQALDDKIKLQSASVNLSNSQNNNTCDKNSKQQVLGAVNDDSDFEIIMPDVEAAEIDDNSHPSMSSVVTNMKHGPLTSSTPLANKQSTSVKREAISTPVVVLEDIAKIPGTTAMSLEKPELVETDNIKASLQSVTTSNLKETLQVLKNSSSMHLQQNVLSNVQSQDPLKKKADDTVTIPSVSENNSSNTDVTSSSTCLIQNSSIPIVMNTLNETQPTADMPCVRNATIATFNNPIVVKSFPVMHQKGLKTAQTIIIDELKAKVYAKDKEIENLKKVLMDRKVLPPSQQRMFPNPLDLKNIEIASLKEELAEVMKNNTQLIVKLEKLQQAPPTIAVPPPISNAPTQDDGPSTTKYFSFDIPEINYKLNDNLNNIDVYIEEHTEFVKVKIEDGFQLYCGVCRKQGKNNNRSQLAKGINYTGDKAYNLENGRSRDWYKMKDTLKTHLEAHKFDKIKCNAAENILAVALTSVKTRCSTTDFVSWLSMLKALGVEIGNSCHGHAHFNKLVVEMRAYAVQKLVNHLKSPMRPTGFEPHFSVAMDWFKFNKETNLAIFLVINIDGERRAVPIDVQVVSSDVIGDENVAEHADIMFRVLKTHLTLEDDDFHRMTSVFTSKPNPILYQYVRNKLNMVNDKFFFNFIDDSDWIDSTAKKVLQFMKFFKLFNKRCVRFQSVFKFDKKKELKVQKLEVKDSNEIELNTPLKSKYCSVLLKELKNHVNSYHSIFASMGDETKYNDKIEEVLYFVDGRDFIMDLCVLIDILTPVTEVIVMTQTENIPPWKVTIWLPRLFRVLKDMEDDLKRCYGGADMPSSQLFPYLHTNWEGIVEDKKRFDEWISTQTVFKPKGPKYLWGTRKLDACLHEYIALCSELRQQLFSMYQTCVEDSTKELRSCFDLECMFDEIVDAEDCSSEVKDKHMENFYLRGFKEFQSFLSFLEKKPQISAGINPMLSYDLFRTWKELFCDLIYKNSHTKGTWFYSKTGERLLLSDEIEKIKFESEEGITKTFYEITLKNNSVISGVRFLEEEFMKFLTQNNDHLSQVDKTLHAVLNYVFSFYLTERNFGQIFFSMKFHEKEGTLTHPKLIDRVIVDCLYPSALQCRSTLTAIAKNVTESGKLYPVTVTKKKKQDSILNTFNAATVRYPFLLDKSDTVEKVDE